VNDGAVDFGSAWVYLNVLLANPGPIIQSIALSNEVTTLTWSSTAGKSYRPPTS
jgi:hypothetical protein